MKRLSIGFLTPNFEPFKRFKSNNPQHDIFIVNDSEAVFGLRFDLIIYGDNSEQLNKVVIENALLRVKN